MVRVVLVTILYLSINACASVMSGQDQIVSVTTPNCIGASCNLTNSAGTYFVMTPGTITIDREVDDLNVVCEKDGYEPFSMRVRSATNGMAFWNIPLGGVLGAGVDMATGAAFEYPSEVINPLDCRTPDQVAAAPKSGRYDQAARALVDLQNCEEPKFVFRDGIRDVYKCICVDGTVGVIGCSEGKCQPLNVSSAVPENEEDEGEFDSE